MTRYFSAHLKYPRRWAHQTAKLSIGGVAKAIAAHARCKKLGDGARVIMTSRGERLFGPRDAQSRRTRRPQARRQKRDERAIGQCCNPLGTASLPFRQASRVPRAIRRGRSPPEWVRHYMALISLVLTPTMRVA